MVWKVGAARNLDIIEDDSWDGDAAKTEIFAWAGFDGDDPMPAQARRGFLIYDDEEPELRASYKLPFARVVDGELRASAAGLRAAASRLPQTDAPQDVLDEARGVIDGYQARMEEDEERTMQRAIDYENQISRVMRAFYKEHSMTGYYPVRVLDEFLVVEGTFEDDFFLYQVPYVETADGMIEFAPQEEWEGGNFVFQVGAREWRGLIRKRRNGGFMVQRAADGTPWWIAWSASAFKARDDKFITTRALERDVQRSPTNRGPLLIGHIDEFEIGECLFAEVAGRFLVEAGTFHDNPLAELAVRYYETTDDDLGVSIRWLTPESGLVVDEYRDVFIIERSELPLAMAADQTTSFVLEQRTMNDLLGRLVASDDSEIAAKVRQAIADGKEASEILEALGMEARSHDAQRDEAQEPVTEPSDAPDAPAALTVEDVQAVVLEAMGTFSEKIGEQLSALRADMVTDAESMVGAMDTLGKRVAAVERQHELRTNVAAGIDALFANRASISDDTALDLEKPADAALAAQTRGQPMSAVERARTQYNAQHKIS